MKNKALIQVFVAIILAVAAGMLAGPNSEIFGIPLIQLFGLIGQLFLQALNLVVVPLVVASIITGTARIGADHAFASLGSRTAGYFILVSSIAILIGMSIAIIAAPGTLQTAASPDSASLEMMPQFAEIQKQADENALQRIGDILLKIVPNNIIAAAANGQMMGLILFSMLFGYFMSTVGSPHLGVIKSFWQAVFEIMMKITQLVIRALPFGVFGLVAKAVATTGWDAIQSTGWFFVTVLAGLAIYTFIVLPILLKIYGISPLAHFRAMLPALATAFSTTSSAATLPVTMECIEKEAGVSNRISSFILPLGTSVNLSGSALYVCISVLFISQSYGMTLEPLSYFIIAFMTLIAALGTAGIPSASMIQVILILHTLGLPAESIGLIMAVERILDMFRTPVNVFGNSCCAVMLAKGQGESLYRHSIKS